VAKKRVGKFPTVVRQRAVDRLHQCDNIGALAKELGIHRRLLYAWREKLKPLERGEGPPGTSREATLRQEMSHLKRVLAEKVLEADFFKGALHNVEARRQRSGKTGARASTARSGR